MEVKLTKEQLERWLDNEEEEFGIEAFRKKHNIDADSNVFYQTFTRWAKDGTLQRLRRGWYRRVKEVTPVVWWNMDSEKVLDFVFPWGHEDNTEFDISDHIELFPGDMIVVAGRSNYGKTTLVINMLAENVDKYDCILMGSEYTAVDGKISPKFKRRLTNMKWVNWFNEDGTAKFTLLPVSDNFEDYIKADKVNIIDWVTLPGEYYMIDAVMKRIKDRIGNGLGIIVIQKGKGLEWGEGGERTERYADLYLTIDSYGEFESRLTVGRVKAPKGKISGRSWVFKIVDYGANLHDIREVRKCYKCYGRGYTKSGDCEVCFGKGYVELK